jgi:hypothetical protein
MPGISGSLAKLATSVPPLRLHQHQSGTPFVLVQAPRQFCESFQRNICVVQIGLRKPDAEAFQFVVEAIGMPLSAFFSSMTFLRTSKAPEPAGFRRSM